MQIFIDKDFQDRTVLHLITFHAYPQLMADPKVGLLLEKMWQGGLTIKCDGRASHYSKLTVMSTAALKKLPGDKIYMSDILQLQKKDEDGKKTDDRKKNVEDQYFTEQYLFRRSSIALIFQKGFGTSCLIVVIFSYINIQY